MKPRWLDRTVVLGPYLTLCLSDAEYRKAAKRMKWPPDTDTWCNPGSGRVHMRLDCSEPAAIVCIAETSDDAVVIAGLMAHEATHIWQEWCRSMGEAAPGNEISAYAVQNLTVLLMSEWARRKSG